MRGDAEGLDLPRGYLVVKTTGHEDVFAPGATFTLSRADGSEVCYFTGNVKQQLIATLAYADHELRFASNPDPVWSDRRRKFYAAARQRQLTAFEALYRGSAKAGA